MLDFMYLLSHFYVSFFSPFYMVSVLTTCTMNFNVKFVNVMCIFRYKLYIQFGHHIGISLYSLWVWDLEKAVLNFIRKYLAVFVSQPFRLRPHFWIHHFWIHHFCPTPPSSPRTHEELLMYSCLMLEVLVFFLRFFYSQTSPILFLYSCSFFIVLLFTNVLF